MPRSVPLVMIAPKQLPTASKAAQAIVMRIGTKFGRFLLEGGPGENGGGGFMTYIGSSSGLWPYVFDGRPAARIWSGVADISQRFTSGA
jgi:hypothetical protein